MCQYDTDHHAYCLSLSLLLRGGVVAVVVVVVIVLHPGCRHRASHCWLLVRHIAVFRSKGKPSSCSLRVVGPHSSPQLLVAVLVAVLPVLLVAVLAAPCSWAGQCVACFDWRSATPPRPSAYSMQRERAATPRHAAQPDTCTPTDDGQSERTAREDAGVVVAL